MQRKTYYALAVVVFLGVLVVLWTSAVRSQASASATQTDGQGGITIKATYATAAYFKAAPNDPLAGKVDLDHNIAFAIALDTHSGDLSNYDFVKNTVLRNDRGQQVAPIRWMATTDGSHHRAGGLIFPKADQAGRAVAPQAKTLELVVRNLGAAERVLRWALPVEGGRSIRATTGPS